MQVEDFKLTEEQKDLLFNDPDFQRIVSRVVLKDSSNMTKSYEDLIIDEVCFGFDIDREGLMSKSQKHCYTIPRYVAMYVMMVCTTTVRLSPTDIAALFGKQRVIVNHAVKTIEWEIFANRKVERVVKRVKELVKTKKKNESTKSVR